MATINNNPMADNVARVLQGHSASLDLAVRRLSTGLRINSAADDAAGLAIRELMRSDVAVLYQGMRNANDAISMLELADGALGIIDEKLIRMKELAEQAATGTYSSIQRQLIDSEFAAMASEIDRIANATDFNGIKLLDGSLSGAHNGGALNATGAMKIHFGAGNDSAEDYYYVEIGDCTTKGLGLWGASLSGPSGPHQTFTGEHSYADIGFGPPFSDLNDLGSSYLQVDTGDSPASLFALNVPQGQWVAGCVQDGSGQLEGNANTMLIVPKGTKNFVFNQIGAAEGGVADNDIQLFTRNGVHLAGRAPVPDYPDGKLADYCDKMGFALSQYDGSHVNTGASGYDKGNTLDFTTYNGMNIGFSGDGPTFDTICRYELLTIDEVTEDLVIWLPGIAGAGFKYYADFSNVPGGTGAQPGIPGGNTGNAMIRIDTQEKAQQALVTVDQAIVKKDGIRAHIGALQNRLENTVTNISTQAENLQAAESRISDVDVAREMTEFVKKQVLAQASTAMLGQANSYPHLLVNLLNT